MDNFLRNILEETEKMFPGATKVDIVVTSDEVKANASYCGEISDYSMKKIDGGWCSRRKVK